MTRRGFTFLEVLSMMLLVAIGLAAVIGLLRSGIRIQTEAQATATGMATALTVLHDPTPLSTQPSASAAGWQADMRHLALVADAGDTNVDGWLLESGSGTVGAGYATVGTAFSGDRNLTVSGHLNNYYVRRVETSPASSIVDGRARWAFVTVDVYEGNGGRLVASVKRRILRTWANP